MRKTAWIVVPLAALVLLAGCVADAQAQQPAKRWVGVVTVRGADEQYSGQYDSRRFKLRGGTQKLTGIVTPDPGLAEMDMADWWMASWHVEKQSGAWDWAYLTMDPEEGSGTTMTARFHLRKGTYRILPISANCTWTATLWEKR